MMLGEEKSETGIPVSLDQSLVMLRTSFVYSSFIVRRACTRVKLTA